MDASDIRGLDELGNLIEAARCLGLVQSRKAFGQYGADDAASEHGLHASISERSARLRAEVEALKKERAAAEIVHRETATTVLMQMAEVQRLRDALRVILEADWTSDRIRNIARKALEGGA